MDNWIYGMAKVADYRLCAGSGKAIPEAAEMLHADVSQAIRQGWQPLGGVSMSLDTGERLSFSFKRS